MEHKHLNFTEIPLVAGFRLQCKPMEIKIHSKNSGKIINVVYSRQALNELDARACECTKCDQEVKAFLSKIQDKRNLRRCGKNNTSGHMHFEFEMGVFTKEDIVPGSKKIAHLIISLFTEHPKTEDLGIRISSIAISENNILCVTADVVRKNESEGFMEIRQKIFKKMEKFFK